MPERIINQPSGRLHPSNSREVKEISPEERLQARQLSIQRDQIKEAPTEIKDIPEADHASVEAEMDKGSPSLEEMFAKGIDRKWTELSDKVGGILEPGERASVEVAGHLISMERNETAVEFRVDDQAQSSEHAREVMERHSAQINHAIQQQLQQRLAQERRREQERRRRKNHHKRRSHDRYDDQKKRDRDQRSYEAQLKGQKYVIKQMQKGEDLEL